MIDSTANTLVEAKRSVARDSIRMAIGQLADSNELNVAATSCKAEECAYAHTYAHQLKTGNTRACLQVFLMRPGGFEPPTRGLEVRCSVP